jgi:hypothetical protein
MRPSIALMLIGSLAACAYSPDQVRDAAPPLFSTSPVDPPKTALCLQRHWERQNGEINGQLVQIGNGALELQIRQQDYGVIALYDLRPSSAGRSLVHMWYIPGFTGWPTAQGLDALLLSCR